MSNLTECQTCKKEVAKSAKLCPHCGVKRGLKTLDKFGSFTLYRTKVK